MQGLCLREGSSKSVKFETQRPRRSLTKQPNPDPERFKDAQIDDRHLYSIRESPFRTLRLQKAIFLEVSILPLFSTTVFASPAPSNLLHPSSPSTTRTASLRTWRPSYKPSCFSTSPVCHQMSIPISLSRHISKINSCLPCPTQRYLNYISQRLCSERKFLSCSFLSFKNIADLRFPSRTLLMVVVSILIRIKKRIFWLYQCSYTPFFLIKPHFSLSWSCIAAIMLICELLWLSPCTWAGADRFSIVAVFEFLIAQCVDLFKKKLNKELGFWIFLVWYVDSSFCICSRTLADGHSV